MKRVRKRKREGVETGSGGAEKSRAEGEAWSMREVCVHVCVRAQQKLCDDRKERRVHVHKHMHAAAASGGGFLNAAVGLCCRAKAEANS